MHTQEVLTAIDVPLSTVVEAESSVRRYLSSADAGSLEPSRRGPERTIDADINRLATLTLDNATQQAHVRQLRQDAAVRSAPFARERKPSGRVAPSVRLTPMHNKPPWMQRAPRCERCARKRIGSSPTACRWTGLR